MSLTLQFNKIHNRFKLNGHHFSHKELKAVAYSFIKEGEPFEKEVGDFLMDWCNDSPTLRVQTSGSTGTPKTMELSKQAMVESALATGDFFELKPSDTALHCLPARYIAGKMMLVRAMILGWEIDLVEPASNVVFDTQKHYDFCAMVPMQVAESLDSLKNIKTVIIGGAPVSHQLKEKLKNHPVQFYETYGMTETITHIALKKLNGNDASEVFKTLPNITVSTDDRNCLIIDAPRLSEDIITTNDVVNLHSKTAFEWLGRYDNVINSGGVKLHPEQIEKKLQNTIKQRFFITSKADEKLGQKAILIIEGSKTTNLPSTTFKALKPFEIPKETHFVDAFVETPTGKLQREKTFRLIKS